MKLEEIAKKTGTYAGVKFSDKTLEKLSKYVSDNEIPNPNNDWHCTLLFSKKFLPDYEPIRYEKTLKGKPSGFEFFGENKDTLVLKFTCPELSNRHKELMDEHDATYDFDEYIPHVTLSYDAKDVSIEDLPRINFTIEIEKEYKEELTL